MRHQDATPGRRVYYRPHPDAAPEFGFIIRVTDTTVFVHYDGDPDDQIKATPPDRLAYANPDTGDDPPPADPLDDIAPDVLEAARHLLHHYGQPGGYAPGSFSTALIRALEAADYQNRARLLAAFPEYAAPVSIMSSRGATALADWVQARTVS